MIKCKISLQFILEKWLKKYLNYSISKIVINLELVAVKRGKEQTKSRYDGVLLFSARWSNKLKRILLSRSQVWQYWIPNSHSLFGSCCLSHPHFEFSLSLPLKNPRNFPILFKIKILTLLLCCPFFPSFSLLRSFAFVLIALCSCTLQQLAFHRGFAAKRNVAEFEFQGKDNDGASTSEEMDWQRNQSRENQGLGRAQAQNAQKSLRRLLPLPKRPTGTPSFHGGSSLFTSRTLPQRRHQPLERPPRESHARYVLLVLQTVPFFFL